MSGGYAVKAPLVVAKDQTGRNFHFYAGSWIPWLNDEQRAHFLRLGLVEEVRAQAQSDAVADDAPATDTGEAKKPPKVAAKAAWVEWGVSQGHDRAELEALEKQELVDLLG